MRSGRAVALLVAVFAVGSALVAPVRAESIEYSFYRIARTTARPQRLWFTVEFSQFDPEYVYAMFGMTGTGRGWRPTGDTVLADRGRTELSVHDVAGQDTVVCPAKSACNGWMHDERLVPRYEIDSGIPVTDEYYIVARGIYPDIRLYDPHWQVESVPSTTVRLVTARDASSGAGGHSAWVEQYSGTPRTPGDRRGSLAFALLPCDIDGTGAGELVAEGAPLLGGGRALMDCDPMTTRNRSVSAAVGRAATWQVRATATGVSAYRTRLLVIGLPPPPR